MNNAIKVFNTGRLYSVKGQRIAWSVMSSGNVAMVDIDRYIEYVLVIDFGCQLDRDYLRVTSDIENARVLQAYDRHDGTMPGDHNRDEYIEFIEIRPALYKAIRETMP